MDPTIASNVSRLQQDSVSERRSAADELLRSGLAARPAAPELVAAVADDDEQVREAAVGALEELGRPEPTDIAALVTLLADPRADVAYWAATLLGRAAEDARAHVDALAEVLRSDGPELVRSRCIWAIEQIGTDTPNVRDALTNAAAGEDRLASRARRTLTRIQ